MQASAMSGITIVLAMLCAIAPTARAQEAQARLPSAQSIIDRAIEAHGGRAALAAVKTRKARGTYRQSNDTFEADIYIFQQRPALSRTETLLYNGELVVQVVGPDCAWMDYNGQFRLHGDKAEAQMRRDAAIDGLTDWQDFYDSAETIAVEQLDGAHVRIVRMTAADGLHADYLFDAERGLLVGKRERRHIDDERTYPLTTTYSDFKPFDGITLPTTIIRIQGEGDNAVTITHTIRRYQHNVDLPSDAFDTPGPVQELIDESEAEAGEDGGRQPPS